MQHTNLQVDDKPDFASGWDLRNTNLDLLDQFDPMYLDYQAKVAFRTRVLCIPRNGKVTLVIARECSAFPLSPICASMK